ncbi:MAG: hypothetical protein JWN14_1499 [Chthonomonadales bacterium]|nr:hypothetical protein [Chthonomonadales bacterium]
MKTRLSIAYKMAMLATATCASCLLLPPDAIAQTSPPVGNSPLPFSASNAPANLAKYLDVLAQRYQVRIVLDPEIEAPAAFAKSEKSVTLTTALTGLTRQMKNATWQHLSLKREAELPSSAKLAAAVRALNRLTQAELLVESSGKKPGTLLLSLPRSRTPEAQPELDLLDPKPVYLLYNTALPADGKTAVERIAESQQQQGKLLAQLPPAQRPNPARLGMKVMQNLAGTGREAALHATGEAGMAAWQNTAPDTRDAMIQHFIKTVQSAPPLDSDPTAAPDAGATAPQNHLDTLREIAAILAKQYDIRILIDPTLFVPTPPVRPSKEKTLIQALDLLTQSIPASAWHAVYQKPPTAASPTTPSARSLAVTMRLLDHMPPALLHLENAVSRQSVTLQSDLTITEFPAKVIAHHFAARPTYLLYATLEETDPSLSVAQRLGLLQRQQMEQLLNLNSSQMNQVMTEALAQYSSGTAETSDQMMHLPIMALLMGTWFPQQAKEHASPPP